MLAAAVLAALAAASGAAAATTGDAHVVDMFASTLPASAKHVELKPFEKLTMSIALTIDDAPALARAVERFSSPTSAEWGGRLHIDELADIVGAKDSAVNRCRQWLLSANVTDSRLVRTSEFG